MSSHEGICFKQYELFLLLDESELPAEAVGMTDQSRQAKAKPHHLKSFPPLHTYGTNWMGVDKSGFRVAL